MKPSTLDANSAFFVVYSSAKFESGLGRETAMLQSLGKEIQHCYRKAEECARKAEIVHDKAVRADYLCSEQRWSELAHSYELGQRLTLFIDESRKGKNKNNGSRSISETIVDDPAAATARVRPRESGEGGDDPKYLANELIAIVDDDEFARLGLSGLVESFGYRVAVFASAEEYLASDMRESTACLILDVYMPGMSGPDLQARLIADGRCPPIIFATGRFEEQVRKQVSAAGALGYLAKPCNDKALLDCIGQAVRATA